MPAGRLLAPLAVCLVLIACDGSGEAVQAARRQVTRGDLDGAQVALEGASGSEVERLRAEIERASTHRVAVRERIELMLARLGPENSGNTRMELRRMLDEERDPGTRELLERTLSDLTDRRAEMARARDASRGSEDVVTPREPPAPSEATREAGSARERMVARLWADADEARRAREWGRGLALLELLAGQEGVAASEVAERRDALVADARAEALALRTAAWELERGEGPSAAVLLLEAEAGRFPEEGPLASFHRELSDLRELAKAEEAAAAELEEEAYIALSEIVVAGAPLSPDLEPADLARLAGERSAAGDMAGARTLLLAAAQREWPGPQRDDWIGEARDLKGRMALRAELADARRADPEGFAEMGVTGMDADAWTTASGRMPWEAVPIGHLVLAVRMADLSPVARRGLLREQLASGDEREAQRALGELARAVRAGELEALDAANLVSRMRTESGRREYVLEDGEWKPASAVAARERSAAETRLEGALVYAGVGERDEALAALLAELEPDGAMRALRVRMSKALKVLRASRTLDQLERLAARREELDVLRERALALIFDQDTYFYPYNPPEPPHTASEYARAQRDVDQAVGEVRRVWKEQRPVKLTADFRAAVEELGWGSEQLAELGLDAALPPDVPPWAPALPVELDQVGLAELAWSEREARALAEGRLVRARNERVWTEARGGVPGLAEDAIPAASEQEQVRVTNDYRAMMGRRVLAWNARVQVAAQGHSDYMTDTGDFGHFEDDPERHSAVDRMVLVGYRDGVSENVARNGGGARGAHDGWLQSSGHHRNILGRDHTEMASALSGFYWTQNFGRGESYKEDLEE